MLHKQNIIFGTFVRRSDHPDDRHHFTTNVTQCVHNVERTFLVCAVLSLLSDNAVIVRSFNAKSELTTECAANGN